MRRIRRTNPTPTGIIGDVIFQARTFVLTFWLLAGAASACPEGIFEVGSTPAIYAGGATEMPKPTFEAQLDANGTWPFVSTYIRAANLLHLMNENPAAPQFQVYAQSRLSEGDVNRLGAVMTAMHRVAKISIVDQPTAQRMAEGGRKPSLVVDAEGLRGFFSVQQRDTMKAIMLYAEAVGWKPPELTADQKAKMPTEVQQQAYFAELFWHDSKTAPHRERLRVVLEGTRAAMRSDAGKDLSKRYRAAFVPGANLAHGPNRAFQQELRTLVRDHLKRTKPELTDEHFDLVWNAIRERRLDD